VTTTAASLLASHERVLLREDLHPEYRELVEYEVRRYAHEEATRLLELVRRRYGRRVERLTEGGWRSPCPACGAGEDDHILSMFIRSATQVGCLSCGRDMAEILAHRRTGAQCEVCGEQEGVRSFKVKAGRGERWIARCAACAPKRRGR
jgi:hypothetical protein